MCRYLFVRVMIDKYVIVLNILHWSTQKKLHGYLVCDPKAKIVVRITNSHAVTIITEMTMVPLHVYCWLNPPVQYSLTMAPANKQWSNNQEGAESVFTRIIICWPINSWPIFANASRFSLWFGARGFFVVRQSFSQNLMQSTFNCCVGHIHSRHLPGCSQAIKW